MNTIDKTILQQINRARQKALKLKEVRTSSPEFKDASDRVECLEEVIEILKYLIPPKGTKVKKRVVQYDSNGKKIAEYNSVNEAAKAVNRLPNNISNALSKKTKSAGYIWKYAK